MREQHGGEDQVPGAGDGHVRRPSTARRRLLAAVGRSRPALGGSATRWGGRASTTAPTTAMTSRSGGDLEGEQVVGEERLAELRRRCRPATAELAGDVEWCAGRPVVAAGR